MAITKSESASLRRKLYKYIVEIRNAVKEVRKNGKKFDIHDYPAIVVGCEYDIIEECGRSNKAHKRFKERIPCSEPLNVRVLKALKKIRSDVKIPGIFKDEASGETRFLGTCAEDDAATKVLNRIDNTRQGNPLLQHLKFTEAKRPRTGSRKPYCKTCKQLFG